MVGHKDVPRDWWVEACRRVNHPLACVGRDNRFIWINDAWSRLLGYAPSELYEKTWIDITSTEDVGGGMQAVLEVINGGRDEYYLEKSYLRKDGSELPVAITVHRFPISSPEPLICFIVEAIDKSRDYTVKILQSEVQVLKESLLTIEKRIEKESREDLFFDIFLPYVRQHWGIITFLASAAGGLIAGISWFLKHFLE